MTCAFIITLYVILHFNLTQTSSVILIYFVTHSLFGEQKYLYPYMSVSVCLANH